jgi:hypothetical protein
MPTSAQSGVPCAACRTWGILRDPRGGVARCPQCGGEGFTPPRYIRQHFDYQFPIALLGLNGVPVQSPLQLDDDADFEQTGWACNDTAGFQYTIYIVCQSTGQRLMNESTVLSSGGTPCLGILNRNFANGSLAGSASSLLPFPLVKPYVWKGGSVFLATFTPLLNQTPPNQNVQLAMKGYKLYPADTQKAAA